MKRLSVNSDALCKACGEPAAEGLADGGGLWCVRHGRIRVVQALESALFDMLHTYGRDEILPTLAGVEVYNGHDVGCLHSSRLAELSERSERARRALP